MRRRNALIVVFALLVALMAACSESDGNHAQSATSNYWNSHKGDCEPVLRAANRYDVTRVAHCVKLFEMYRHVAEIEDIKERSMYAVAFSKVSQLSPDPYERSVADAALARICIPRHPLINGEIVEHVPDTLMCSQTSDYDINGQDIVSNNPYAGIKSSVTVREVSDKEAARSMSLYKKGAQERKKKAYDSAMRLFEDALSANPFNVSAKYDLACLKAMRGDTLGALKALEELYTWRDSEAESRLLKARSDRDFEAIRDNPNFKLMTGYVRISLLNGASTMGEQKVLEWKRKLEDRDFPVAEVGRSRRNELTPQIWYKPGFDDYANQIRVALGSSKISVAPMDRSASDSDILVVWGQPEAATLGANQKDPVVTGYPPAASNKLKDMTKSLNDANSAVGDTKKAVGNTGDTMNSMTSW